ncbi:MAG: SDR family oxidoreductase [Chloroflexi bacterium]|nr:SDR family oxidoreductase [Chloroflexota bacterium]
MRVFVTGASGFIGSAVVRELLAAGHSVVGLARSDEAAAAVTAFGAGVQRGDLENLDILRRVAADVDGVIHLAFMHDRLFSGGIQAAAEADRRAIETVGNALRGSNRPFVIASGLSGMAPGKVTSERDGHTPDLREAPEGSALAVQLNGLRMRMASAELVLSYAEEDIRSSVVRVSPSCHGEGDRHGFIPRLVALARGKGVSGYLGEGINCWPAVHRLDAARLFRLALEKAPAGSTLHAVADEGVQFRDIAQVIGRRLGVPVVSVARADAAEHFGPMAVFAAIDGRASHELTQELLGWTPTEAGLLEDLEAAHYFEARQPAAA